ncbi:flavin reductase family protein [Gordonia sp. NPDC003376]
MSSPLTQPDTLATAFREAMSNVCAPVAVITTFDGDRPHGTTVSAFMSLSVGPPMVAVALDHGSDVLRLIRDHGRFGVNVLGSAQSALALNFARKGDDKFAEVPWRARAGLPALDGITGWVACVAADFVSGGDHTVVFGEVADVAHDTVEPLTYHRRTFGTNRAHA